MLVSIIIPVFNVAPYIEDCLRSVIRQSYSGPVECLIIDDCGTDNSIAIAERMIAEYDGAIRFKILHHEHNRGLSAARNTGLEMAVGDYVLFVDSDDEIAEDCLEKMMAVVRERPEVELVQGCYMYHRNGINISWPKEIRTTHAISNEEVRNCFYQYKQVPKSAWNKLMSRSLIQKNHLGFIEGLLFEDDPWTFYWLKYVNDAWFLPDITYHYKIRSNSIITGTSRTTAMIHHLMGYHDMIQHISPNYVQQETEYCMLFFTTYIVQRSGGFSFPGLKDDYRYYRRYAWVNRIIKQLILLDLSWSLGNFRYGWVLYSLLLRIKYPSQIPKDYTRLRCWLKRKFESRIPVHDR